MQRAWNQGEVVEQGSGQEKESDGSLSVSWAKRASDWSIIDNQGTICKREEHKVMEP